MLYKEIEQLSLRDQQRLRKRLRGVDKISKETSKQAVLSEIEQDIIVAKTAYIKSTNSLS